MEKYQFTPSEIEALEKEGFALAEIPKIKQTVYSFEDWLKGDPLRLMDGGCGIRGVYMDKEGFSTKKVKENYELYILPEIEWQKIQQRKAAVFKKFEDDYTNALIEDFERLYNGSKERTRLIKQQIEALEKVLFTHGQGVQYRVSANGWGFTLYSFTSYDSGSIYKWYDEVCVKNCHGIYEPQTIVSPRHCSITAKELALEADTLHYIVAALACERFKRYLDAKLLESESPALASKILNETDCYIYQSKLVGMPPPKSDLADLEDPLTTQRQAGKIAVKVNDPTAEEIIKGALKIGLTQGELNVFIGKFAAREYGNWHSGAHFDVLKTKLDTNSLLDEIFGIAQSFDNPALGEYFLESVFDEVQSVNNPSFSSEILVFNKQFKERVTEWNAKAPPALKAKASPKKELPAFEDAVKEPGKLLDLWARLSEMDTAFVTENGNVIGGKKARKHREVMALAQTITPLMKEGFGQFEVYSMLCKRVVLNESPRPDKLPSKPGYNDIRLMILAAIAPVLK